MAEARDGRIELTILGGFLGSGKTTWLRHQLHRAPHPHTLIVVNEAADAPVDGAILAAATRVQALAGGCACCDGLPALVALLRRVCDDRVGGAAESARVDRIILETSGLADPGAILDAVQGDPVLIHHVLVREIVVTVDAVNGQAQLATEPLGRRQVETADRILVTKIDAAFPEDLPRLLALLSALNPSATLSGSILGSPAALPPPSDEPPAEFAALAGAGAAPILSTTLDLGPLPDWTAFSVWLSALLHARGDAIVRIKGVVRTPAGRLLVQSVRRSVQSPEILPEGNPHAAAADNTLAVIGRGFEPRLLSRSLRNFAAR